MSSEKPVFVLLLLLVVFFAHPVCAEDLPELENYQPPAGLFDMEAPSSAESSAPFLTLIEPPPKAETLLRPPKKPVPPVKVVKKKAKKPAVKKAVIKKPAVAAVPVEPVTRSHLPLDVQSLVNPTARDVLESIEGVKSAETSGKGKISLLFMPGETMLTLDMKNKMLKYFVPGVKKQMRTQIAIQAYASSGEGELAARRLSLARALEARDFLVGAGIDSARINVMPLGNQTESLQSDRVDIVSSDAAD